MKLPQRANDSFRR